MKEFASDIASAALLVLDGNCTPEVLAAAAAAARNNSGSRHTTTKVWFEPVSVAKAVRATAILHLLDFVSPNAAELRAMAGALRGGDAARSAADSRKEQPTGWSSFNSPQEALASLAPDISAVLDAGVANIILTIGELGVLICGVGADGKALQPALSGRQGLTTIV